MSNLVANRDSNDEALRRSETLRLELVRKHIAELYEVVQENLLIKARLANAIAERDELKGQILHAVETNRGDLDVLRARLQSVSDCRDAVEAELADLKGIREGSLEASREELRSLDSARSALVTELTDVRAAHAAELQAAHEKVTSLACTRDALEAELSKLKIRRATYESSKTRSQLEIGQLRQDLAEERACIARLIARGEACTIRDDEMNRKAMVAIARAGAFELMSETGRDRLQGASPP